MRFNNSRDKEVKRRSETRRLRGDQIEVFKKLNGYENIDRICFSHSRKIVELEDMR